jgi:hypothetical protein
VRGSEVRTPRGSVLGSLTTSPPSARYDQVVDGPFRVRDQVVDARPGRDRAGARVAGTLTVRGYMAIPLPYASALGEAGLRVAAMGELTARFCACRGPPCNAATGLNETSNLNDRPTTCRLLPDGTRLCWSGCLRLLNGQPFAPTAMDW